MINDFKLQHLDGDFYSYENSDNLFLVIEKLQSTLVFLIFNIDMLWIVIFSILFVKLKYIKRKIGKN